MTAAEAGTSQTTPASGEGKDFAIGRVLTVSAAHGVHDTYTAFLPSLLPVLIASFALSNTQAGLLTVFMQAPSLLQPLIGHLADRVSLRYLVILAPAVTAVMMSLLGVAPSYAVLALLLAVAGVSSASLHAVGPVMAGRMAGDSLGRGMGFWMVGGEAGRTLGPLVIVTAIQLLTLRGLPALSVVGLLVSALLFVLLRQAVGPGQATVEPLPWRKALKGLGSPLLPLIGLIVSRSFMASALTTYLPTFLSGEGAELLVAGASLSVLEGAGVVGALVGGWLSDRLGRRMVLFVSVVTTPLLMFAFLFVQGWLRLPLLLLMGFFALSVGPVLMALVQETSPENRALANGIYMALSFTIRSGVIVLVGALGDFFDLRVAFAGSAVATLLGLPFVLLLPSARGGGTDADG